jgi:hypothetical protein
VLYDTTNNYYRISELRKAFMALIALRRQRIDTKKTIALCRASICGADLISGKKLIELADEALKSYIRDAENLEQEEKLANKELSAQLQREIGKVYRVIPAQ